MFEINDRTDIFFSLSLLIGVFVLAIGFFFDVFLLTLIGIALFALGLGYFLGMHLLHV